MSPKACAGLKRKAAGWAAHRSVEEKQEELGPILDKAVNNLARLDNMWLEAPTIKKRQIVGSIFPEKLVFGGENFRTAKLNEAVRLIYTLDTALGKIKMGQALSF